MQLRLVVSLVNLLICSGDIRSGMRCISNYFSCVLILAHVMRAIWWDTTIEVFHHMD